MPYQRLKKAAQEALPALRSGLIQDLLLTTAGFLPPHPGKKAMSRGRWHLFRVRPQNHPRRRIMGFVCLLDLFLPSGCAQDRPSEGNATFPPWAKKGLVEGMNELVRVSSSLAQVRGRWRALENGLIGRGRARDMGVNCVSPFLHALGRIGGDEELTQLSPKAYHDSPRLQENELTREMQQQLLSHLPATGVGDSERPDDDDQQGWDGVLCNARRQQGLLHLHHLITSLH